MATEPSPAEPPAPVPLRGGAWGTGAAVVLAAVGCGLALVVALGTVDRAPSGALSAVLLVAPHLGVAWLGAVFATWCVLPDRRALPALGAVGLLAGALHWGPAIGHRREVVAGPPVRVMSWNVRRLWGGPSDGGDPLRCVVDAIEREAPDVLALQEISAANLDRLMEALGLSCAHGTYKADASRTQGGLAVCGRSGWTVSRSEVTRFEPAVDWRYLTAELLGPGGALNLLTIHLTPHRSPRGALRGSDAVRGQADQAAALIDRAARFRDPTVIAGDFNSTRDFFLHRALRERYADAWERGGLGFGATTHALGLVPLRVDFLYADPRLAVSRAAIPGEGCSDHRPVVASLVIRPGGGGAAAGHP